MDSQRVTGSSVQRDGQINARTILELCYTTCQVAIPILTIDTFPLSTGGLGPAEPFAMVADASGNLWIDSVGGGRVYQVGIASGAQGATTTLPDAPLGEFLAFDGVNVWLMGQNAAPPSNFLVYILSNGTLSTRYSVGAATSRWPRDVVFDGTFMWILSQPVSPATNSILTKMDLTGASIASLLLAGSPSGDGPAITYDGTFVWAVVGNDLYKIDSTDTVVGTFPISNYTTSGDLQGLTFDGTNIWANDFRIGGIGSLIKINPATGALIAAYPQSVTLLTQTYDGRGNIWFVGEDGTNGYLGIFNIAKSALVLPLTILDTWAPPVTSGPNQIYSDGQGHVWVSTIESTLIRSSLSFTKPPLFLDPVSIPVHHLPFCHRKECIFS